ncbi:MAG: FtsQ-type POTRA domain-containing protein [Burkholderiaceae bacterium]|nr:FtsQ-type POTRA domain-containing protein [Burkholderiaceae bacterium]
MSARAMNLLAALCLALALVAIGVAGFARLAEQPKFRLKRIDVRGELRHVTPASVRSALAGRLRGNYFTTRLEDTRRLFETVPWVAQASVRRVWPDRLVVTVTEHRALGVWEDGRVLSDKGELFVANPDEAEVYGPLPEFSGPPIAAHEAARRFYELSAQFAALSMRIDAIDISERNAWSLRLSPERRLESGDPITSLSAGQSASNSTNQGASRIELGRAELGRDEATASDGKAALTQRVAQLIAAYPLIVAQMGGPPARIDARYANGVTASLTASPTAAAGIKGSKPASRQ